MPFYSNSPDVVRNLLEQRASKTSSVSVSDRPDTPSVYTQFSPRSTYFPEPDSPLPPLPPYLLHSSHYSRRDSSDDELVEEEYTDLEEDDDTQVLTLNHPRSHHVHLDPEHESPELVRKLSLLGPKMKIHSVAPWEVGNGDDVADDNDDDTRSIDSRSIFRGKRKHKSKDRSEKAFKGISLGNVSPHFMRTNRPSHESFHSTEEPPPLPRPLGKAIASTTSLNSLPTTTSRLYPGNLAIPSELGSAPRSVDSPYPIVHTAPITGEQTASRIGKAVQPEGNRIRAASSKGQSLRNSCELQNRIVTANDAIRLKFPSGDIATVNLGPDQVEHLPAGNRHPDADMAGWGEVPGVPTNNLITLEEAFTRSRTRTRSFGTPAESYPISQPSFARTDINLHLADSGHVSHSRQINDVNTGPHVAQQPVTIKHKRSGIMRIFNKERDGERKRALTNYDISTIPPPLPMRMEPTSSLSKQVLDQPSAQAPRTPKRIPVPTMDHQISPTKPSLPLLSIPSSPTCRESTTPKTAVGRSPSEQNAQRKAGPKAGAVARGFEGAAPFPTLSLRPVSALFSEHFNDHILASAPSSATTSDPFSSRSSSSSTTLSTPLTSPLPNTPNFRNGFLPVLPQCSESDTAPDSSSVALQEQLVITKTSWQTQIWDLERQVRELKEEVSRLRGGESCNTCGRGGKLDVGIINRPRGAGGSRTLFGGTRE